MLTHTRLTLSKATGDDDTAAYMAKFLHRTTLLLGEASVARLATKTVAIAGCGGVGGAVAITLARMGVGGFILADPGRFDEPDANRQWAANRTVFGRNKAEVYAEVIRSINPTASFRIVSEGVTDANVDDLLDGADAVVDCLDVAVTAELRARLYRSARATGIHCLAAPMLGFGAVVAIGAPDGMPMEAVFGRTVEDAAAHSQLPPGLRDHIVPEHLATVARHVGSHRVPSVAISPALSAALISTEIYLLLQGAGAPGWRPPHCLPELLVVDPIRMTYRVVSIQDLLQVEGRPEQNGAAGSATAPDAGPEANRSARAAVLSSVGYNTLSLPHDAIAIDLQSDSWSERMLPTPPASMSPSAPASPARTADLHGLLRGRYGYAHAIPVYRGRFAEALLAKACITPGGAVLTNALFPTTRFHLESAGARVVEVGVSEADDLYDPHPFKGEIDLAAVERALASGGLPADHVGTDDARLDPDDSARPVQAIYIELCANAIGGHPVRLSHLRAVRDLAAAHGVPVLLDATRAYANAALLREREPGQAGRPLADIVRDLCACSTACAASLAKDFVTPIGGFVGTNDPALFVAMRDLALLAYGDGLRDGDRASIAAALAVTSDDAGDAHAARLATVRRLQGALTARSIPVVGPPGGHAVFVDAAAFLPHVGADGHRAMALAGALFATGGVRVGVHLDTPRQAAAGVELVRLAVPAGGLSDADVEAVSEAFRTAYVGRAGITGLRRLEGVGGMVGQLVAPYEAL